MSSANGGEIVYFKDDEGNTARWYIRDGYTFGVFRDTVEECDKLHDDIMKFKVRPDDVWICAFFKSGTHWIWEVTMMLLTGADDLLPQPKEEVMIENNDAASLESAQSPRVLNTHHFIDVLPKNIWGARNKIIHIVRNIKDVLVSLYHHKKKAGTVTCGFDSFVKLHEQSVIKSWYDYENDWWTRHKDNPDVLFVMYEEMIKNPRKVMKTVAEFLTVPVTDDRLRTIAEKTSIQHMRANKAEVGPGKRSTEKGTMFRKGQPGDWKNHFTVATNEQFDQSHAGRMKELDFEVVYD